MDYSKFKKSELIELLQKRDRTICDLERDYDNLESDIEFYYTHNDDIPDSNFILEEMVKTLQIMDTMKDFSEFRLQEFNEQLDKILCYKLEN